jgi:hypothetical protein
VGSTAVLDAVVKRKIPSPARNRTLELRVQESWILLVNNGFVHAVSVYDCHGFVMRWPC